MKRRIIGVILVGVGLIGCLFPIAPGIPLVIAGAALILGFKPKNSKIYKKLFGGENEPAPEATTE